MGWWGTSPGLATIVCVGRISDWPVWGRAGVPDARNHQRRVGANKGWLDFMQYLVCDY